MKRFVLFATLALILVAATAMADTKPNMVRGGFGTHHGQAINMSKALGDTLYLVGNPQNPDQVGNLGGPVENGTFEDEFGNPAWNGWTSLDNTFQSDVFWQVSDFNAINGNYSYWCGTYFDGDPGYGNDWNQVVLFSYAVDDPGATYSVNWSAVVQNDTEPGYDYTYLEWNDGGVWVVLAQYDGNRFFEPNFTWSMGPSSFVGSGNDEIQLRIRGVSDGAWSDEDDLWDTNGMCQVDDVSVTISLGGTPEASFFEDFEDQQAEDWPVDVLPGVGDYAWLYINLQDEDPCRSNLSPQVAFVDDGVVVPGTGGSPGVTWRYGPGGYIVNNTGGPAGPDFYIDNLIISPELEWPVGSEAAYIEFGVYRHEELGAFNTWPGMFYQWHVRSVNTGNAADLEGAPWVNRNFVQYGGPDYLNQQESVTDLLATGRTHMQLSLRVIEFGYVWGWVGTDGTPGPYFDNVKVVAYPFAGPGVSGRDIDWWNDNFPESGTIDLVDLDNNDVPLDAAQSIAQDDDLVNYPGDTMWFDASPVRGGSVLDDFPKVHVRIKANPLFDYNTVRGNMSVLQDFNRVAGYFDNGFDLIEGWVYADSAIQTEQGNWVENRWEVDLPDEDFLYPGDVMKWHVEATDNVSGDVGTTLMPADTAGWDNGPADLYDLDYPIAFIVRALPTVFNLAGDQPEVLFWNDFVGRGGDNEWLFALNNIGMQLGVDYDMYATNGPSSGVGNGLGGRASSAQLSGYETLLYTSGDLSVNLIANGDFNNDPSNDIQIVQNWFAQGDKNALFTGDEFVRGMRDAGATGEAFINTYLPVSFVQNTVGPLIGNQTAPLVSAMDGNGIITRVDEWIAFGGCLGINSFDAVTAAGTSQRLAEFTNSQGNPGVYNYAAALYNNLSSENADVVYMPYDFMFIYNAPGYTPPAGYEGISARAVILEDILGFFGTTGGSPVIGADAPAAGLQVENFPNPFNPQTTIKLRLPQEGDVSLKVFNVRGELVRTLVDGQMDAGEHSIIWDGKTNAGNQTASGVYFYETRANGEVKINKMALVK